MNPVAVAESSWAAYPDAVHVDAAAAAQVLNSESPVLPRNPGMLAACRKMGKTQITVGGATQDEPIAVERDQLPAVRHPLGEDAQPRHDKTSWASLRDGKQVFLA